MPKEWTYDNINNTIRSYQRVCVLAAAAELELFAVLQDEPLTAEQTAKRLEGDLRATRTLLDALASLKLLDKQGDRYATPASIIPLLTDNRAGAALAMTQHQANCMRRWMRLAEVIKSGKPVERPPSVRGEEGDKQSFIIAMDNICGPLAVEVVEALEPLYFTHLLDVGGASGTWTLALLKNHPDARATLFDLPHVLPLAEERFSAAGMTDRITLVAGDALVDPLPTGVDLAWVSAIVHQFSRAENRTLFANIFKSLTPGGRILIRDIVMEDSRIEPVAGALFAINMLVGTEAGGTFTLAELREDLESAGFTDVHIAHPGEGMNAVTAATKPTR